MTTIDRIRAILQHGRLEECIGLREDDWFDAKRWPAYDFSTAEGRIELAKDVTGFANAQGGYLVIGLRTTILVEEKTEAVSDLELLSKDDFDISKFQGLIREHVYPEILGLAVAWVPSSVEPGNGLGVIEVPPQDDSRKPFLMTRVLDGAEQLKQIVFGIAQRVGSSTIPLTIQQLYTMTQNGNSEGSRRLTRLEGKMDSVLHALSREGPMEADTGADLERKIRRLMES